MAVNPIDVVAGAILVLAGIMLMAGFSNLGVFIAGIGMLIEAIKAMLKQPLGTMVLLFSGKGLERLSSIHIFLIKYASDSLIMSSLYLNMELFLVHF